MHSARAPYGAGRVWTASCADCQAQFPDWCGSEVKAAGQWNARHYDYCGICGRLKEGLLCHKEIFDFPYRDFIHTD